MMSCVFLSLKNMDLGSTPKTHLGTIANSI